MPAMSPPQNRRYLKMMQFLTDYGWSFLLTLNAIGSFFWSIWVTQTIRNNKLEMQVLRIDYQSWLDNEREKLH